MMTPQQILFEDIAENLVSIPKRDALDPLSDRQLSNLVLVVREASKELDAFIAVIQTVQMEREDERITATVS